MSIKNTFQEIEDVLVKSIKHTPFEDGWSDDFPDHGGVYVLWKRDVPVYVGETSGIRSRMADLMRPANHAFTKKISIILETEDLDFIRKHITRDYRLSYAQIEFGRSEIEEYLILRWRNTLVNKPTKRLLKGSQYLWVEPI